MAGANVIHKYAYVNREDQLAPFKAIGTEFEQRVPVTIVGSTVTAAQLLGDLIFTAGSVTPFAGPTAAQVAFLMGQGAPITQYSRFSIQVQNTDGVAKVINLGAGFSPASVTIPANTIQTLSWEQTSPAGVAPAFSLYSQNTNISPIVVPGGVTSFNGRMNVVVSIAGDYDSTMVDNSSVVLGGFGSVTDALNQLETEIGILTNTKVDYFITPAVPVATDILVNTIGGNQYHPSGTNLAGRLGALLLGAALGTGQTPGGYRQEILLSGNTPTNGGQGINHTAPTSAVQNYSLQTISTGDTAFGDGGLNSGYNLQRLIFPALMNTEGNFATALGAFFQQCYRNNVIVAGIASNGNVKITPAVTAGVTAINVDLAGVLTTGVIPSYLKAKKDIVDLPESDWIQNIKPRQFQYREGYGIQNYPRYGAIIEEMKEAGAPDEAFIWSRKKDDPSQIDRENPFAEGIHWDAVTVSLLREVQKLRFELEEVKDLIRSQ